MSGRLATRFVPLGMDVSWRLEGDAPSWRLDLGECVGWRLGDHLERAMSLLDVPVAMPELPSAGPMAPAPARLAPISDLGVASGIAMPWMTWTEINDRTGHYMERFAPGAFTAALQNRDQPIVSLFNHGHDPAAGYKSLGPLSVWEANDGLRFDLAFLNAGYARDVAEGARYGLYGASVRFGAQTERAVRRPQRSQSNPAGIEERTITGARLIEISLTALPAYSGTSAVVTA